MPGVIVVAGIPGVGKTTILDEVQKTVKRKKLAIDVVNFGTVMTRVFRRHGQTLRRDEMRRKRIEVQRKIQVEAAKEIASQARKRTILVDTHVFVRTAAGVWPGLPLQVIQPLRPRMIVLFEASPKEISDRRRKDRLRIRDGEVQEKVVSQLEWSRRMASADAVLTGAPVKIIRNEKGQQKRAARELLETIEKHL